MLLYTNKKVSLKSHNCIDFNSCGHPEGKQDFKRAQESPVRKSKYISNSKQTLRAQNYILQLIGPIQLQLR